MPRRIQQSQTLNKNANPNPPHMEILEQDTIDEKVINVYVSPDRTTAVVSSSIQMFLLLADV